jgi:hypothetical protein
MEGDLGMRNPDFTFSVTDAVGRHRPPNMDDATAIGHFILIGVLAGVVIIQGMHDAQVEKELIQNLRETEKKPLCDHSPLHCLHALLAPHTTVTGTLISFSSRSTLISAGFPSLGGSSGGAPPLLPSSSSSSALTSSIR